MNRNSNTLIKILLFLTFFFLSADLLSIKIESMTIRLANLISFFLIVLILPEIKINIKTTVTLCVFMSIVIMTSFFSENFFRTAYYVFYLGYLLVFFVLVIPSMNSEVVMKLFHSSHLLIAISTVMVWVLSSFGFSGFSWMLDPNLNFNRVRLWTYEPSYLATYLSTYLLFLVLSEEVFSLRKLSRLGIVTLAVGCTFSVTGIVGILISYGFFMFRILNIGKTRIAIMGILAVSGFSWLFTRMDVIGYLIKRFALAGNLSAVGGSRVAQYANLWNVFLNNVWFGVGLNAIVPREDFWISNVTLEILATGGLFLLFAFLILLGYVLKLPSHGSPVVRALKMALLFHIVLLQINQSYIRLYTWLYIGLILSVSICYRKNLDTT